MGSATGAEPSLPGAVRELTHTATQPRTLNYPVHVQPKLHWVRSCRVR